MKLSCECIQCVLGSALELMQKQLPDSQHQNVVKNMLTLAARQDWQ